MNAGFAPHEAGVIIPGPFHLRRARPVIGYALGRSGLSAFPPYDSELVSLHVLKEHQGQGFGQALIAEMAQSLQ